MSFQGSINNLLNTAAIFHRMSPEYEKKQELHSIKKQMSGYKAQAELADANKETRTDAQIEAENKLANKIVAASERRLELDPSIENYRAHMQNVAAGESYEKSGKKVLEQRRAEEEARVNLITEQERIAKSRESAMAATRASLLSNTPKSAKDLIKEKEALEAEQYGE